MKAVVYAGQLVYVDTDEGKIGIFDKDDQDFTLTINAKTDLNGWTWQEMISDRVEAIELIWYKGGIYNGKISFKG
jgi:hypothetical protein